MQHAESWTLSLSHLTPGSRCRSCVFQGNQVTWNGGAVYGFDADMTFNGCTFTNNLASYHGGAVATQGELGRTRFTG
jgi:predicted outer membrane repeat protein